MTAQHTSHPDDALVIAGKAYSSRLLTGTGKFKDLDETRRATEAAGAEIVTVAIRRTNIGQDPGEPNLLDVLPPDRYTILPNTAGCYTAEEAVRTCRLGRELLDGHPLTKLDVLDGVERLKMCSAYRYRGKDTEYAPLDGQGWDECEPVYLEFPGWSENPHGITDWDDLPPAARAYLQALEELAGCPISIVSTGPDRDHTMVLQDPFS